MLGLIWQAFLPGVELGDKNEAFELKCMGADHSFVQGCNQTEAPRTYVRQMWPIYLQVPRTD